MQKSDWKPFAYIVGGLLISSQLAKINIFGGPKGKDKEHLTNKYDEHKDTIIDNAPDQSNLSFPRQVYKDVADIQYEAMNGPGTDKKTLFDSLKGMNRDDLLTVFMDFGLRAPTVFGIATSGRRNLLQWYRSDLSNTFRPDLKRMLDIWQKTGLTRSY